MSLTGTATRMAWATLQYLVFYRFVIGVAPAVSVAAQTLVGTRRIGRPAAWPVALVVGAATSPRASAIARVLAASAGGGSDPLIPVALLVGAHFLTPYYLFLTGPLLGKDVLLSHLIGASLCLTITRVLWRPGKLVPGGDLVEAAEETLLERVIRELAGVGPHVVIGLALGGLVAAWGLSPVHVVPAALLGGGLAAQVGNAVLGTALGVVSCLPPVANLFVATYLWKTGIAHAGLVSFVLAVGRDADPPEALPSEARGRDGRRALAGAPHRGAVRWDRHRRPLSPCGAHHPLSPDGGAAAVRRRCPPRAAVCLAGVLAAGAVHAAPIRTVSPSTGIFLGNVIVGRASFVEASGAGAHVSARIFPVAGFYSPTTATLFGLVVPYVQRHLTLRRVGEATSDGLGDVTLIGHYRFLNRVGPGYADQAAARIGVELPTGSIDRRLGFRVPEPVRRTLQPGSGATNVTFTLAGGREHRRYNVDVDAGYRTTTERDDFRFGGEAFADLSVQAFLFPTRTRSRGFETLAGLEFRFTHDKHDLLRGKSVANTGGDALTVAPGVQLITGRLLFEVLVRLPAVESPNGRQPTLDHDVLAGVRLAF